MGRIAEHHHCGAKNNPCMNCGLPFYRHRKQRFREGRIQEDTRKRVFHIPQGDPCQKRSKKTGETCGLPESMHKHHDYLYVGIDGEGITEGRERWHKYALLAAVSEDGTIIKNKYIEDLDRGLNTERCLDFLVNLPVTGEYERFFGYSLNYDWTKILEDLPDEKLYLLFRPELRKRAAHDHPERGPKPVSWNGYVLNMQGTKFSIRRNCRDGTCILKRNALWKEYDRTGNSSILNQKTLHDCKHVKRIVIWDLFKFYQSKFVKALEAWKVGNAALWERMREMKDKRSTFDKTQWLSIKKYCFEECQCMAELAHKLVIAHEEAGLELKNFYGAGSSGQAILQKMGIKEKIVPPPDKMKPAVAQAFFGGWFENSWIGEMPVETFGPVDNWDISSAYPYQTTFMPCLLHGRWDRTTHRVELDTARAALVHYTLGNIPRNNENYKAWAPFPFREKDGSISHPIESAGGWVWLDEYLMGEKYWPHVIFKEAWVYHSDCVCQPFEMMPSFYRERCRIGKEGAGIVLKLGPNSVYGKLAQSVGMAQYNSWVWAGMITSGTRAQMLQMIGLHKNWWDVLMIATDGIFTRDHTIVPPEPKDTNTQSTGKPLGGWEKKPITKGLFCARPGVYFPLNPTTKEIDSVRARGVGKATVLEQWQKIVNGYRKYGIDAPVKLTSINRFCGAKTSIHMSEEVIFDDEKGIVRIPKYTRAGYDMNDAQLILFSRDLVPMKAPYYGQWIIRPTNITFRPMPKRIGIIPGETGLAQRLQLRKIPLEYGESAPYKAALISHDKAILQQATEEMLEQPSADFIDFDSDNEF